MTTLEKKVIFLEKEIESLKSFMMSMIPLDEELRSSVAKKIEKRSKLPSSFVLKNGSFSKK